VTFTCGQTGEDCDFVMRWGKEEEVGHEPENSSPLTCFGSRGQYIERRESDDDDETTDVDDNDEGPAHALDDGEGDWRCTALTSHTCSATSPFKSQYTAHMLASVCLLGLLCG